MLKSLQIFRHGSHTASNGKTIKFTPADLTAIAKNYNPALSQAPIVIGHPATNDPAYGWVNGLRVQDGALMADVGEVDRGFQEMVKEGKYKKISASFYSPSSPNNPSPGAYYLRHVGFLGAIPPAVKGLSPVAFSEEGSGIIKFDVAICPYKLLGAQIANAGYENPIHFNEKEMNEYQLEGKLIAEA